MAERTVPGLGVTAYYDDGQDDWGDQVSADLRLLSVVARGWCKSRTTSLPGSGSAGDVYIIPTGDTDAGDVAIWDGASGAEAWVKLTPQTGWLFHVEDDDEFVRYASSDWDVIGGSTGSAGQVYDLALSLPGATFTDGEVILEFTVGRDAKFNLNPGVSECSCDTAPTSQADFIVKLDGVEQGKLRIASSQTEGSGVATTSQPFDADRDDVITIEAPASADATIAGFHCTIWGETR